MLDSNTLSNLLQVLQILAIIAGGFIFLFRIESKLAIVTSVQENFTERLGNIDRELKELAKITIEIARQDERMTSQDLRINTIAIRLDEMSKNHLRYPTRQKNKG